MPFLRPSKNRTHDWSDNGVCECVRPNNATVQWGGVGGARGEGEEGGVRTLPQSKFCPTRQTASLPPLSSINRALSSQ